MVETDPELQELFNKKKTLLDKMSHDAQQRTAENERISEEASESVKSIKESFETLKKKSTL
jgi:flagellar biosynthesis/type III secretory pathway chaperone